MTSINNTGIDINSSDKSNLAHSSHTKRSWFSLPRAKSSPHHSNSSKKWFSLPRTHSSGTDLTRISETSTVSSHAESLHSTQNHPYLTLPNENLKSKTIAKRHNYSNLKATLQPIPELNITKITPSISIHEGSPVDTVGRVPSVVGFNKDDNLPHLAWSHSLESEIFGSLDRAITLQPFELDSSNKIDQSYHRGYSQSLDRTKHNSHHKSSDIKPVNYQSLDRGKYRPSNASYSHNFPSGERVDYTSQISFPSPSVDQKGSWSTLKSANSDERLPKTSIESSQSFQNKLSDSRLEGTVPLDKVSMESIRTSRPVDLDLPKDLPMTDFYGFLVKSVNTMELKKIQYRERERFKKWELMKGAKLTLHQKVDEMI
ncbi:hypothetical protein HDV02_001372 [Globomyces sp. JEL0801]|nr:hypothetical protein HDV02_001372 [Globomyces sp. JEL0801]